MGRGLPKKAVPCMGECNFVVFGILVLIKLVEEIEKLRSSDYVGMSFIKGKDLLE